MLMRTHDGGVDRNVPVHVTGRVGRGLNLLQQPLPRPVRRPLPMTFIDGLPWPEPLGKITPVHPGSHPVQDPVDHLPMVSPPATPVVADRQERPQPRQEKLSIVVDGRVLGELPGKSFGVEGAV